MCLSVFPSNSEKKISKELLMKYVKTLQLIISKRNGNLVKKSV